MIKSEGRKKCCASSSETFLARQALNSVMVSSAPSRNEQEWRVEGAYMRIAYSSTLACSSIAMASSRLSIAFCIGLLVKFGLRATVLALSSAFLTLSSASLTLWSISLTLSADSLTSRRRRKMARSADFVGPSRPRLEGKFHWETLLSRERKSQLWPAAFGTTS